MTSIYKLILSTQFKKDLKKSRKQQKNITKLEIALDLLSNGDELPTYYRNHLLTGNWQGYFECHIEPDWLLIYRINDDSIYLARLSSHSDLFKK